MVIRLSVVNLLDMKSELRKALWKPLPLHTSSLVAVNGTQKEKYVDDFLDEQLAPYVLIKTAMVSERMQDEAPEGQKRFVDKMRYFLGSSREQSSFLYLVVEWQLRLRWIPSVIQPMPLFKALFLRQKSLRVECNDPRAVGTFLRDHLLETSAGSLLEEHPYERGLHDEGLAHRLMDMFQFADELVREVYRSGEKAFIHPMISERLAESAFMEYRLAARIFNCWRDHGSPVNPIVERR